MEREEILVSVVLPVKNGDYWLDNTLSGILGQRIQGRLEVIVIDSGSSDQTLSIVKKYPVRLIQIPPDQFNHGRTRNLGAIEARGRYVAMTVQDARPIDEFWLKNLLEGFVDDTVAGVCGQQVVPHETDTNPIEWFRPQNPPGIKKYSFPSGVAEQLNPDQKREIFGWDNVTAMYRKDALLSIPFRELSFAEDAAWAYDAVTNGYSIVYNTAARVFHFHLEDPSFVERRLFTVYYHFYMFFGFLPKPVKNGPWRILRDIRILVKEDKLSAQEKLHWLRYNLRLRKSYNVNIRKFLNFAKLGEEALRSKHSELCASPPQASKPKI